MKKDQITFEDYKGLFLNEILKLPAPALTFQFVQIKTKKSLF